MNRFAALLVLASACGCHAEPAEDPMKAWDRLRAAVAADDPAATLACFNDASRDKELAGNKLLLTMAPKSLPPVLAERAKKEETSPWPPERLAGELLLFKAKRTWRVGDAESASVESVAGKGAVLISLQPRSRVRWALVLEGKKWKFDAAGTKGIERVLGEASDSPSECRNRLFQMGIDVMTFESKMRTYPASWADVKQAGLQADDRLSCCSFGKAGSFVYCYPIDLDRTRADWMLGWDPARHPDGKRTVLYFQGKVEALDEAVFQERLAAQMKEVEGRLDGILETARKALAGAPENADFKRRVAGLEGLKALPGK
jgi:hypothetical protein